ncbi:PREDICTED: putative small ubiquitin-related modifier 7 [Camelina sativa]|uniref:Small ubiquitin-related modifier 7 n=1 Tax=Camelina sativa TaxID=90675 RepID=A0ABM0UTK7_CAMSA|nr:PREDICTED: putative small ubiquitin-related modifier 7 [Camelina sativa]XP_010485149.1 PREDICTED: putative small ubiquitin-related modifier 7 [Camelina sativa]
MSASDKKPLVPSSHISIKIKSQDDICVYFRIKRDVELRTMMHAYSAKVGQQMSCFRFHFDGIRIKPNQTPNELELEDGDEIDALVEQTAGFSHSHPIVTT